MSTESELREAVKALICPKGEIALGVLIERAEEHGAWSKAEAHRLYLAALNLAVLLNRNEGDEH